jgi:YcxB-like protein
MVVEYTLNPEDVASARLLALGIRPQVEFALFAAAIAALMAWSVSIWSFALLPLLIGLTASLGGFRLIQIQRVKEAAIAAFHRNPTLRQLTAASWDELGITIHPAGALSERILWAELKPLKENERLVLLRQGAGTFHAIPKRAFSDKQSLAAFRRLARKHESKLRT